MKDVPRRNSLHGAMSFPAHGGHSDMIQERLAKTLDGHDLVGGVHGYETARAVWNGMVDRRPRLIARCRNVADVRAAVLAARDLSLEIGVRCGGHSVVGLGIPDDGLMIDLTPMGVVRVDPIQKRARVQGGALLGALDKTTQQHGLATTAGNVSHTGVGGLTLCRGMGWLARQLGLACDNLEACTVVTADGRVVRASESENPDLLWGLRGGGGNFGIVTEFEFRLHPIRGRALIADFVFDAADGPHAMRGWRDLLPDAPRAATLTASATTVGGVRIVNVGCVWVGDMAEGQRYLSTFRELGKSTTERVREMSYVELQSISDDPNSHGVRRYSKGHYLTELSDDAIDAFVARGLSTDIIDPDWTRVPNGGFQPYGGEITDVGDDDAAFSHRRTLGR